LSLKKWVERRRSDEDQRSVRVHVTPAGRSVLNATSGRVSGVLQQAVRQIDEQQLLQLDQSLEVLLRHIGSSRPVVVKNGRPRARRSQSP
jgi:DNA-binding MarR family transcriptional regulator